MGSNYREIISDQIIMSNQITLCPCGSKKQFAECCQPIHQSAASATHPEQIMRARYSAHVLGLVDFVVATYHPRCEAEQHREAIADSVHSKWLGLQVINSEIADNGEGFVEFRAMYQDGKDQYTLHERSRFLQKTVNGELQWFYIDGDYPENHTAEETAETPPAIQPAVSTKTIGRNDPCTCGSGKKFKKCCG